MSEYGEVEKPFLDQLPEQGWTLLDQGSGIPQQASPSLRSNFRHWLLPQVEKSGSGGVGLDWICEKLAA